mmetsp:Transcript_23156/g.78230  ORF Transcript_23156/g.78230 Transcript_23156/m.78230 type:complete len:103 (-) Transcript_23156:34-342(-)
MQTLRGCSTASARSPCPKHCCGCRTRRRACNERARMRRWVTYVPHLTDAQTQLKVLKRAEGYDPSDSSGIGEQLEHYSFTLPEEIKDLPECKKQWPPVELEG